MTTTATGLRELADWLDANPQYDDEVTVEAKAYPPERIEVVEAWARAMGRANKNYLDNLFELTRRFAGGVTLRIVFWRSTVCEKVVTTREVTSLVPDPAVDVPMVEVTETVEDVEWVCNPIFAEADQVPA